jgi:D-glycero-alpha-D-manno-heptose-7-phosphate kinase
MHVGICPVRISFAGGGTDLPEYYEEFGGCVIGSTINKFTYVIIHPRIDKTFQSFSPDFQKHYKPKNLKKIEIEDGTEISAAIIKFLNYKDGLDIILCSDVPGGSGLGASSSLAVNVINTINFIDGKNFNFKKIAETAFRIERDILNWPMGKQDEYLTVSGGLRFFEFKKNKVLSKKININKKTQSELERNLLLFFVGKTRKSSSILHNQIKRTKEKNKKTIESLHFTKHLAESLFDSLNNSDITKFGELLDAGWNAKKSFSSNVTNQKIDSIYDYSLKHGAIGGKITGAGGGGHLLLYCEKKKQKSLINKLQKIGLTHVPFSFYHKRPQVINLQNFLEKNNG